MKEDDINNFCKRKNNLINVKKKTAGRPTLYNFDTAKEICERIATGESLSSIAREPGMPAYSTIMRWVQDDVEGFEEMYSYARECQGCYWADLAIDLAEKIENQEICEKEAKVILDTLKWTAERQAPRKYGVKKAVDISSSDGSMSPKQATGPTTIIVKGVKPVDYDDE